MEKLNLVLESIQLVKYVVGNVEVLQIDSEECDELVRVEDSGVKSKDGRISLEVLLEEGQDDYDCTHFYTYDLEGDCVIGYFKIKY